MSIHFDNAGSRWVIRFRDADGRNRNITVSSKNLRRYGQFVPPKITERVAKKLEQVVLNRETSADGSIRTVGRRQELWLNVVARYLPPMLDKNGEDLWKNRPPAERLENEKTYSRSQLNLMQLVLTAYFPSYLDHRKIEWEDKGKRQHSKKKDVYVCTRRIGDVTREDVAGFQIYLTEVRLSTTSVRHYMVALKTFLAWCLARGYLMSNPAVGVKLPAREKREVHWLAKDDAKALLKAVKKHPLEGPVNVILNLGLRRSEMCRLEWNDVNFDRKMVKIRGTKTEKAYREVPLPPPLASYLKGLKRSSQFPNVLLNKEGKPWNKESLNSSLRRFLKSKIVPFDWNFQMLRATYGSLLVLEGKPIAHVSLALGHTDVQTTQTWYIGLDTTDVSSELSDAITKALS